MAKLHISWSFAAFKRCSFELEATQNLVIKEVGEIADWAGGWFFHVLTSPFGHMLRCDGQPGADGWQVQVALAEYHDNFPVLIQDAENRKFAEYSEIKKLWKHG